jgi:transposase
MVLSIELRKKIIQAYNNKYGSYQAISDIFDVGICSVRRMVAKDKKKESLIPVRPPGRPPKISDDELPFIEKLLTDRSDLTILKICTEFKSQKNKVVSGKMVETALRKLNFTRKKSLLWQQSKKHPALKN